VGKVEREKVKVKTRNAGPFASGVLGLTWSDIPGFGLGVLLFVLVFLVNF
jgi:hypothetical protein